MYLNVTPKGSLRAFIAAVISCILLTWAAAAFAKHPVKATPAGNTYTGWLHAYLLQHPDAPVAKEQEGITLWGLGAAPGSLWSFAASQSSTVNGLCLGCGVANAGLAVDDDTTTYSSLVTLVGVGGTVTQQLTFPGSYQAGDYIALDLEVPGQLLSASLLTGITVQTLNNGTLNTDAATLNGSLTGLSVLGLGGSKFRAVFPAASAFNAVQITTGATLAALGSLRIYDAVAMVPVTVNPDSTVVVSGQSAAFNASIRLSGATFKWYTQPTGGAAVYTGAAFNTPAVTQPTNYYVEATTPDNLTSFIRTPVNVRVSGAPGPIWTYGDAQQSPITSGVACALCAVNNPAQAVDGDTTTASAFSIPVGVLGALGQRVIFPGVYYAGDSLVLIMETSENLLTTQLLSGITVQTYHDAILGPAVANDDATTLDNSLAQVDLLGLVGSNRKFRVALPLQNTADAVQVTLQPAVALALTEPLRLYEAVAMVPVTVTPSPAAVTYNQTATLTPSSRIAGATYNWYASPTGGTPLATGTFTTPPLTRNATYYVEGVDPDGKTSFERTAVQVTVSGGTGPLWTYGVDQQSPVTGGIACALCTVTNPGLAVDEDTTTASHLVLPLGVATYVGQYIRFPAEYQAGDSVVFFLGTTSDPLATANLLNGLRVQTFNGNTPNGDAATLDNSLVKVDLLGINGGINKFRVSFPATQPFDGARIDLTSAIGLSDGLDVYEAAAMMPVQVTRVNPASDTVEIGNPASFTAGIPRIPDATFSWYETPEGGTPVYTGADFTTPDLLDNKVYYVEAFSPSDGLHSLIRTAVPVYVKVANSLDCGAADAQSNSTTGVCILCGVTNPLLAIDGDINTASQLRISLGVLGSVYQSFGFPALSGAADTLRIGIGNPTGLLDLGALAGLTVTLYNGATQVAQYNDPNLLDLRLLNDTAHGELVFAPGVAFDSARVDFNAVLAAITTLNIYYAKYTAPGAGVQDSVVRVCPGGSAVLKAVTPAGATFRWYDAYTGGNLLFTGAIFTPANITSDTTFYVEAVSTGPNACGSNTRTPVQVMLGLPAVAVTPADTTIDKGTTATFNVIGPHAGYIYNWFTAETGGAAVDTGVQFTTPALDSNAVFYVQADSSGCTSRRTPVYVTISALPAAPDIIPDTAYVSTGQTATFRIANPDPTLTYRWYNVATGGTVLATDTIYTTPAVTANGNIYAEAVNASNQASRTRTQAVIQLVNAPGGLPCTYANTQESPVYTAPISICLLCGVSEPGNAIDGDTTTASHIRSNIGIGYIGQMLHFQQSGMAGDSLRLVLGLPGGLTDAQVLGGVQVQLYNNGNPVGDPVILNNVLNIANLQLLNGNKFMATIPAAGTYNAVMVSLGGVLSAITTLDLYNAEQVILPAKPSADTDSLTVCLGSSARLVATDTTGVIVSWYAAPTGGAALSTGGTFTTPALNQASTTYYIGTGRNGCSNTTRIPVTVKAVAQPAAPQLTAAATSICVGQTAALSVLNPQAGVTYTWYDAPTGGSQVDTGATLSIVPAATGVDTLHYYVAASRATCTSSSRTGGSVYISDRCNGGNVSDTAAITVCGGSRIALTVDSVQAGATYQWYNAANNSLVFTGTSFTTPALNADVMYRLEAAFSGGVRDTIRVYDINVEDSLATPVLLVGEAFTTSGGTATFTVANSLGGVTYTWYSTPTGGTPLATGVSFTTPPLTGDSAKYYVAAGTGSCVSSARGVATLRLSGSSGVPCSMANATQSPVYTDPLSICLLCGVTNAANAVDGDSTTASQVRASIGVGYIGQVLNFQHPGLAGDSIRLILSLPTGLTDAQLLGGVRVQMYSNGSAAGNPLFLNGGLGVLNLTLVNGNVFAATFAAPVNYDAVYVSLGGVLTALSTLEIYSAQQQLVPAKPSADTDSLTVCLGSSAHLVATDTTGVTVKWYGSAAGGTPLATGGAFNTPALNQASTTYYIETSRNGCANRVRVPVTVHARSCGSPGADTTTVTICSGTGTTLTVTTPVTGATYHWYNTANNSQVGTGTSFNTPVLNANASYRVVAALSGGTLDTVQVYNVVVISNLQPPAVVTSIQSANLGGTVTFSIANPQSGITYKWYSTATGGTPIATGAGFITPPLAMDSVNYYVAAATGSCESAARTKVTVKAGNGGGTPGDTTYITVCTGSSLTLDVASPQTGAIYRWYNTANNSLVFTGTTFTTPVLNANITYLVEATLPGGTKDTNQVYIITVADNTTPPVVVADTVKVCSGQDAVLIVQNPLPGFTYQWFDAATGGALVYTGPVFTVAGVTTSRNYYVQSVLNNKCVSATRTRVSVQAGSAPAAPAVASNNVITCINGTAAFSILNPDPAVTYRWYDQPANGALLAIGTSYTTPALSGTTTYYVEAAYNAGCVSTARTGVTATVVSTIDAPLASGVAACAGQPAILKVTGPQAGVIYRWYSTAAGGAALFTGSSFTTPALTANTTYYVEAASGGGCVSASRTPVSVTVNSTPPAPVVASANVTVCPGQTATLSIPSPAAGITYRWYTTVTGGSPVTTGPEFTTGTLNANQQYYVEAVNASGCASMQRTPVSVTVGAPDANDITVTVPDPECPGLPVTFTASAPSVPGANFRWYSTATGGTQLYTGAEFTTPALDSAATYYVEVFTGSGCASTTRKAVTAAMLQQLAAPVVHVTDSTANSITFSWSPVPGAVGYEVSTNGSEFNPPSSGANGTTHTVTGLSPNQAVGLQVRAIGNSSCQNSGLSALVTGRSSNPAGNQVFIPNLFSPNGDGANDVLMVYGNTIATMELHIYNYWGQEVFQSKDQRQGWDGSMSGRAQPAGVYVYILKATLRDGTMVNRKGNITLIR